MNCSNIHIYTFCKHLSLILGGIFSVCFLNTVIFQVYCLPRGSWWMQQFMNGWFDIHCHNSRQAVSYQFSIKKNDKLHRVYNHRKHSNSKINWANLQCLPWRLFRVTHAKTFLISFDISLDEVYHDRKNKINRNLDWSKYILTNCNSTENIMIHLSQCRNNSFTNHLSFLGTMNWNCIQMMLNSLQVGI